MKSNAIESQEQGRSTKLPGSKQIAHSSASGRPSPSSNLTLGSVSNAALSLQGAIANTRTPAASSTTSYLFASQLLGASFKRLQGVRIREQCQMAAHSDESLHHGITLHVSTASCEDFDPASDLSFLSTFNLFLWRILPWLHPAPAKDVR